MGRGTLQKAAVFVRKPMSSRQKIVALILYGFYGNVKVEKGRNTLSMAKKVHCGDLPYMLVSFHLTPQFEATTPTVIEFKSQASCCEVKCGCSPYSACVANE